MPKSRVGIVSKCVLALGLASLAACGAAVSPSVAQPSPDYHSPVTHSGNSVPITSGATNTH
jgi:hypothetical protein